jgi:hypothetical protein
MFRAANRSRFSGVKSVTVTETGQTEMAVMHPFRSVSDTAANPFLTATVLLTFRRSLLNNQSSNGTYDALIRGWNK